MTGTRKPNKLVHEKSPYLLQHALNPVDWQTWGDEAFAQARAEDKPIFLSIGYSTCHWCHVMEHESFEDEQIAELLNTHFIPIKVDREERPDVDRIYMTALQVMGQGGGWPVSMFLRPDLEPFYGGTYFPPSSRYGRAGFGEVLLRIRQIWQKEREKVQDAAARMHSYLRELTEAQGETTALTASVADICFQQLSGTYDAVLGGFGGSPKFPRPALFSFLLRYHRSTKEPLAREMAEQTLQKMAQGGMYDHLGGGFHRYAVDAEWRVPHFEKMIYDQAQLVRSYLDTFRVSKDPFFARVARDTLTYVQRDMTSPEGGFYSAEDADSARPENPEEEGEGAFYVWTKNEVLDLLGEDGPLFCYYYGVEEDGNATVDPQHEFTGRNILYEAHLVAETARVFHQSPEEVQTRLVAARARLLAVRDRRLRPLRDDKILLSWNGMMISAFAHAYQVFHEESYLATAEAAVDAVMNRMYDFESDSLVRRYRDGESRFDAHLDDYAFFVQALIDLYETTGGEQRLSLAVKLTERQIQLFWDEKNGGFFETSGSDRSLLVRMKEQYDGAEPTGNSVAVSNLIRLARAVNRPAWEDMARAALEAFSPWLSKQPAVMPNMVVSLIALLHEPRQIVLAGNIGDKRMRALQHEVFSRYTPELSILYSRGTEGAHDGGVVSSRVAELGMRDGIPTAYLCEDFVCRLPTTDQEDLSRQLG